MMPVSSRDILMRVIAKNLPADSTPVDMVTTFEFNTPTTSLYFRSSY